MKHLQASRIRWKTQRTSCLWCLKQWCDPTATCLQIHNLYCYVTELTMIWDAHFVGYSLFFRLMSQAKCVSTFPKERSQLFTQDVLPFHKTLWFGRHNTQQVLLVVTSKLLFCHVVIGENLCVSQQTHCNTDSRGEFWSWKVLLQTGRQLMLYMSF
jgi:hypothetical protein